MNKYLSSAGLKSLAKGQLLGKYGTVVPIYAIHIAFILLINFSAYTLVNTTTLVGAIIFYAISVLINLLNGLFVYGETYIYLKVACNGEVKINDLFYGFKTVPETILKVQLPFALVSLICGLPSLLSPAVIKNPEKPYLLLTYVLLAILATVIEVIFTLTFSQCYFLMLDFPQYSHKDIFQQSRKIMKGNRGRLFYIELSFIPLLCLGLCTCCVAYLWILPYYQATKTNFYLDLIKKR